MGNAFGDTRQNMSDWTSTLVEERLNEAAAVMRRLPAVRVQGYFNTWPTMKTEFDDLIGQTPEPMRLSPPTAAAITRMEETLAWLRWLEAENVILAGRASLSSLRISRPSLPTGSSVGRNASW